MSEEVMREKDWSNKVVSFLFQYNATQKIRTEHRVTGVLNRIVQLAIIGFFSFGILWKKEYQITSPVTGTVTTKLKGASYYDGSLGNYTEFCDEVNINRTFDIGDYVIPPQEHNSFFVLTNLWQSCNQSQGLCAEDTDVHGSNCNLSEPVNNTACGVGKVFEAGHGPTTGRCVPGSNGKGQCEIKGWCEVQMENDAITDAGPKIDVSEFTVLINNYIEFPKIQKGLRKRNIKEGANKTFLQTCRHDSSNQDGLYCPIFTLKQIVDMIQETDRTPKQDIRKISIRGGVVGLEIHWDCDHLERNLDHCHPKYVAKRYDNPEANLPQSYNFRYSQYYNDNGVQKRTLTKAYGILFKIEIYGTGGKFEFFTMAFKIGSGISYLAIVMYQLTVATLSTGL